MSGSDDEKKDSGTVPEYKFFGDGATAGYSFGLDGDAAQPANPALNTNLPDWFASATTPGVVSNYSAGATPAAKADPVNNPGRATYQAPPALPELTDRPALKALPPLTDLAALPDLPTLPDLAPLPDLPASARYQPASTGYQPASTGYQPPTAPAMPVGPKPLPQSVSQSAAPPMPAVRRTEAAGRAKPLDLAADSRFSGLNLPAELATTVERIFSLNDLDFNGFVDFSEITKMLEGEELTASEKQFVLLIYQVGKKIVAERPIDHGVVPVMSKQDFKLAFASILKDVMPTLAAGAPPASITASGLPAQPAVGQPFRPTVYAEEDYPLGSIKAQAVRLGTMGDAYFAAALVSLIDLHPRSIMRMINLAADQCFTVTFPGMHGKTLDLLPPRAEEIMHYGLAQKYGYWYPLLEKAFGMYVAQRHKLASSMEHGKDPLARVAQAIEALTNGQIGTLVVADFNPEALRQYILDVLSKGKIMVAMSTDNISQASTIAGAAPLPSKPYAVQGFDQNSNKMIVRGVGTVNLSNLDEAVLRLSAEEFVHYFKTIFYEKEAERPIVGGPDPHAVSNPATGMNHWRKLPEQ